MGPDKETGVAYCSVGALVWVRRRNGSWWPGKIVGPEELSDAHLLSPRSGTPVKLLGREDASVDWYNLEKSKRVKAFRCGEFDDCIERAESSLGMPPKKREKYARREDAILHALELEKKLLGEEYSKPGSSSSGKSSKSSDPAEKVLVSPSESLGKDSGKHVHPKSHFKKLDLATDYKSMDHLLHAQKIKEENILVRDEDNSEPIRRTRMRGLQNIGLKISHLSRKLPSSVASNSSQDHGFDNSTENTVQASYLDQRMKSDEVLTDESLVRRRDRRRPLDQVLQSSAKFPVHSPRQYGNGNIPIFRSEEEQTRVIRCAKRGRFVDIPGESSDFSDGKQFCTNQMVIPPSQFEESEGPHPAALDEETASEDTESDSSETDSVDSDADEEIATLSDAALVTELEPKSPRSSGTQVPHGSMSSEELDDLALSSDASHLFPCNLVGVSKWKLKGKRNNRGVPNRSTVFRSSTYRTNLEEWKSTTRDEPDLTENNFRRSGSFDNQRFLLPSKSTSKGLDDFTHKIIDWEDSWNDQLVARHSPSESSWKRYWEEDSSNCFDPVLVGHYSSGGRMKSMLVDVDLKVQSSYQREHVPLISLMSKLNGKAIIGHPIQIEALENGASEILLSAADGIENDDTEEPPVWRTSTRTAKFRVQRPHPLSELDDDSFGHKAIRPRFNHRKYSKKQPKKISMSSGKKIKALSSIGTEQKLRNNFRGVENFQVDSLIKGESGPTAVACIPVKLVFSRLYEEMVGRHQ